LIPDFLNFSKSAAVKLSGSLFHFACSGKLSVIGQSMSMTSERSMSAIALAEYSRVCAKQAEAAAIDHRSGEYGQTGSGGADDQIAPRNMSRG
jgi:hypothetical protein